MPSNKGATCYVCGEPATLWIRSSSQHFSAPRCDECGNDLVEGFKAHGVTDVTVDAIRAPVPA
jgi:hypothetical protein